jgi:hypothetical protein
MDRKGQNWGGAALSAFWFAVDIAFAIVILVILFDIIDLVPDWSIFEEVQMEFLGKDSRQWAAISAVFLGSLSVLGFVVGAAQSSVAAVTGDDPTSAW